MERPSSPSSGSEPHLLHERDDGGHLIVQVDTELCRAVAGRIKSSFVPEDREDVELRDIPAELLGNFFLFVVAICHQTSPIGLPRLQGFVDGHLRAGWDYLLGKFHDQAKKNLSLLLPSAWSEMTVTRLVALFNDEKFGNLLSAVPERVSLIQDLGARMTAQGWQWADEFFELCGGRIASGEPNLLDLLACFHAFRDPVRKKSLFFLSLMRNSSRWKFSDEQALEPPVDYHEVRGHLRVGTVRIEDSHLLAKVVAGAEVTEREDIAIRRAVLNAILLISELSGVRDASRMHYLFWNIFRGVCTRIEPRCSSCERPPLLPERYLTQLDVDAQYHCPFEKVCRSAHLPAPIAEHVFITDYY